MPLHDEAHLPPGLTLAWGLPAKSPRLGRKPTQSVEQVVAAAVELADTDGFAAVSMPKLARKLGLTANAIYRYVRSRDELLVLLGEAGWGPPPSEVADAPDWRSGSALWTQAMVDRCDIHPWLCDLPIRGAPVTPNLLGWAETILRVLTKAGLRPAESLSCALLLDGFARQIAAARRDVRDSATTSVEPAAVAQFLQPRLHQLGYTILASLIAGEEYTDEVHDSDVSFGMERILDGIETLISRKTASSQRAGHQHHR